MDKKIIVLLLVISVTLPLFSGCVEEEGHVNETPIVEIAYPRSGSTVSNLVMISGSATDPDGDDTIVQVEVKIDDDEWNIADGTTKWSYDWRAYENDDGMYNVFVRSWDGIDYSEIEEIIVKVSNPKTVGSDAHKWAVFVVAANFPKNNDSKLGNGGLFLAEEMADYLINNCDYSTSNIIILFDDGWIRTDNGYGHPIKTLQQRNHQYDITYGGATKQNFLTAINYVVSEANKYPDSEFFLWISSHGCGDENNTFTGGKTLEKSEIWLWDNKLSDVELGTLLTDLNSDETCVIIDACFSGGFADKTIYNFPTLFLLKSGIPKAGRVVISGASKFRVGYASTTQGPLFSLIWFEGIKTGNADGYRQGFLNSGRPTNLKLHKDGKVSVEEAFYYARYMLKNDQTLEEFSNMEPQINDQYPHKGLLRSIKGMILG